jgi:hypothetical protein
MGGVMCRIQFGRRTWLTAGWVGLLLALRLPLESRAQGQPPVSLTERWSVGVLEGDERFAFGNVEAMAIGEDGKHVFVLDRLNHRLTALTQTGQFIGSAGRNGHGPGEFQWPSAVIADDSVAMVFDAAIGRMSSWVVRENTIALKGEVSSTIFLETRAACSLGGTIVLLRSLHGKTLQQIAPDGTLVQSFGEPFSPERHPMMAAATTFGYVACDRRNRSIFVAGSQVPVVRRYRDSGDLLWETAVPNIHPPVITPVGAGIRYSPPDGRQYSQVVTSLVPLGDSIVVVQFGDGGPHIAQPSDITSVTTVVMSAVDGRVLWQGTGLPRLDLADERHVYSHPNDPFPHVTLFEWRSR